jgi:hypothetical protein
MSSFKAVLERDACEAYLFQFSFMNHIGDRLNLLFAIAFLFAVATIVTQIYITATQDSPEKAFITSQSTLTYPTVLVVTFLYAFPIWCMARANSSVDMMVNMVVGSGVNDFDVIGGRDVWIDFFSANPCFWRLFGYPLTFNTLGVAIASVLAPVCYFILPPDKIMEMLQGSVTDDAAA